MAVMFKINADPMPCQIVKFIIGTETQMIDKTQCFEPEPYTEESQFLNCIRLDPNMVFVQTWYRSFFLDDNLELLKVMTILDLDPSMQLFSACRPAYKADNEQTFLFACNIDKENQKERKYALQYNGQTTPNEWSSVFRAKINTKEMCVEPFDHSVSSILLKNEIVWSVFEFEKDCMLLTLNNTPNLLMI